jgi:hypothetical protein
MKTSVKSGVRALGGCAVLAAALWIALEMKVFSQADSQQDIPPVLKGKAFTIYFPDGSQMQVLGYISTIPINKDQWWLLNAVPPGRDKPARLLINPQQVQRLLVERL